MGDPLKTTTKKKDRSLFNTRMLFKVYQVTINQWKSRCKKYCDDKINKIQSIFYTQGKSKKKNKSFIQDV